MIDVTDYYMAKTQFDEIIANVSYNRGNYSDDISENIKVEESKHLILSNDSMFPC